MARLVSVEECGPYWAHVYESLSDPEEGHLVFLVLKEEHKIQEKENKENKRNKENLRNCFAGCKAGIRRALASMFYSGTVSDSHTKESSTKNLHKLYYSEYY